MKAKFKPPKTKCPICGTIFTKTHNRQKYCTPECSKEAKRRQDRQAWTRWFHKNRKRLYQTQLGTRTISPHMNPDPNREAEIIQNEKNRTLKSNFFDYNMKV